MPRTYCELESLDKAMAIIAEVQDALLLSDEVRGEKYGTHSLVLLLGKAYELLQKTDVQVHKLQETQ
jgi:hypothetical protein